MRRYRIFLGEILLVVFFTSILFIGAKAQTGPAGIGTSSENVLWLRADQGTSTTTDGIPISSWNDNSGNGNDAAQGTGLNQPLFKSLGIYGLPSISFDGSDDYLTVPDADNLDNTSGVSIFVVAQPNNIDAQPRGLVSKRVNSTTERAYSLFTFNSSNLYFDSPDRIEGIAVTNNPQILTGVYDGSVTNPRARVFQDGVQTGSGNSGVTIGNMASDLYIGILDAAYGQGFRGDISEVIIYRSALNNAERLILETYLANRYNISLSSTAYSSTTHTQDFVGIGFANDDKYSNTENVGSGILLSENNNSLDETNEFVFAGHDGTAHGIVSAPDPDLPVISGVSLDERWQRIYYIERVQDGTIDNGTTDIRIGFDFTGTGITLDEDKVYYLLYRSGTSGAFSEVSGGTATATDGKVWINVSDANFTSGYYTIARSDQEVKTWYSRFGGDWDDPDTWSLKTTEPDNPFSEIPGIMDRAVILNNSTVTVTLDNTQCGILDVIDGIVDFGTTTGNSFSTITGQSNGKIRLAADNFPSGDATGFADAATGGTVEYYGTGYDLSNSRTFRNMLINLDNNTDQLILLSDYTLNGNLTIMQGELYFGNTVATASRNVTVYENLEVQANGKIRTGSANARHELNLYGNFTNYGDVQFTNRSAANYTAEATDGIVDVNFLSATRDQNMTLEGPTRFYRIAIEKGISNTYALNMEATDANYFKLYGYASEGHPDNEQLAENNNAFGLAYGTVRVGNNITIPYLNRGGNYNVSENAILWVDGGTVTKESGSGEAVVVYGKIKVSGGTFNSFARSGITTRLNGTLESTGGTTNLNQFRTSVFGTQHQGGYVQSGGTVNLLAGALSTDYYRFTLTYTGNVFSMTGGTLHIQQTGGRGGIFINSDVVNQNVAGGTVICDISNNNDFIITSKAPFWNLEMRKTVTNSNNFILDEGVDVGGTNEYLAAQPLVVLNDLTLNTNVSFDANQKDVYIGRNFTIEDNALYIFHENTTHFNGTSSATLYIGDITALSNPSYTDPEGADPYADWEQPFYGFTIDKPSNVTLTLATGCTYDAGGTGPVDNGSGCKNINDYRSNLIKVTGPFTLESGRFDIDEFSVRLYDEITNKGIFAIDADPVNALVKTREESTASTRTVTTTDGAEFGNLRVNLGAGIIEFTSDVYVKRMEYRHGRVDIGTHNLKIDTLVFSLTDETDGKDFSVQDMIIMDGNASDGGLSLYVPQVNNPGDIASGVPSFNSNVYLFPIGTGTTGTYPGSRYTPANIRFASVSDDGYVTVNIVSSQLQTTAGALGNDDLLNKYFRIRNEGFSTPPKVERYRLHFTEADIPDGSNDNEMVNASPTWNPGYVLDNTPYTRTYEINDGATASSGFQDVGVQDIRVFYWGNEGATMPGTGNPVGGFDLIEANYTAGVAARFVGAPEIFYNRRNNQGSWASLASWFMDENQTLAATSIPAAGDIVILRGDFWTDNITVNGNRQVAKIVFEREGAYADIESLPRLRLETTDVLTAGIITGVGDIYLRRTIAGGATLNADIGEFAANDTSVVEFYMVNGTGTFNVALVDFFDVLPTLRIYGNNANYNRSVSFNYDMNIKNLIVDGESILNMAGNYTVENRTRLGFTGGGRILYPNGTDSYTLKTGEFVTGRGKPQQENTFRVTVEGGGGNGIEHTFEVERDINLNFPGTVAGEGSVIFDLFSTINDNNVILKLSGTGDYSFIDNYSPGNSTIELYKIEMNKGTDQSSTFTFNNYFTLQGLTDGTTGEKAIQLQNGKLILNNSGIYIDLSSGGEDFYIPSTSGLVVQNGQVNVYGADNGILLDGLLRADGTTSIINMDGGSGVDNYIEYSASGNATIEIENDAQLTVGSQIRRGTTSAEGILKYKQTGGTVIVGKNTAPVGNRGTFEILNNGSEFTHTGGTLTIVNSQSSPTVASVILEPSTRNVGDATLQLGNDDTPVASTLTLQSNVALGNLTVSGTNGPTAQLLNRSLVVNRDLRIIGAGSTFDGAGSFNLTVNRHILNSGTADLNVDTLFLKGTNTSPSEAMQEITGDITVNHLVVEPETSVELQAGSDLQINGDLYLNNGQLIDGANTILVNGNVINNASHASSNSAAGGIKFGGAALQRIYGTGQFGRIEIDNTNGVQLENDISLNKNLTLTNGILQLQSNKLTLGLDADIEGSGFDDTKMIAVGGGDFLQGIQKTIPTVASSSPVDPYDELDAAYAGGYTFTFPLGVATGSTQKYTPVDFHIASNATQGTIGLHPVNRKHITFDATQTDVLQYYWIMNSSGLSDFTSLIHTHYKDIVPGNDVVGDESAYIGAKLYDNFWAKYEEIDYDLGPPEVLAVEVVYEADDYVAFITSGVNRVTGEYTAGIKAHIPDQVPIFYSKQDGDWTDANTWEREDGGVVPAGGPVGQRAHIRTAHTVTVSTNYRRAYRTTINGRLELGTTKNHILGYVDGTGTLSVENSSLPAGDYMDFFACGTGGTMEWAGGTYGLPSSNTEYNNLTITGTGTKTFPNKNITICGDLTIEGNATLKQYEYASPYLYTTINGNVYLKDNAVWDMRQYSIIMLNGDFEKDNSANFNSYPYYQFFYIQGSVDQTITGDFTGVNRFANLRFNNPGIVQLNGPVDVNNYLMLDKGRVQTSTANILRDIKNASNGLLRVRDPFVDVEGPISININNTSPNQFLPIGKNNIRKFFYPLNLPATVGTWIGEYFNTSPTDAGMSHLSMVNPPLETISQSEYWAITGPAGVSSRIELKLNGTSDVAAGATDINNLRIVYWNGSAWEVAGTDATITGDANDGKISTTGTFTFDGTEQYFTIGTIETVEILTATITSISESICESDTYDLDVTIVGNYPNFDLDYSIGATNYTETNIGTLDHTITLSLPDLSLGSNTITLNEIRDSDSPSNTGSIIGGSVTVTVYADHSTPYPTVTSGGNICGATTTTVELDGSDGGFTYELFLGTNFFSSLAGTGGALTFTGIDQAGTYTVVAYNSSFSSCTADMNGFAEIEFGSAATAEITSLITPTICEGEAVELEITFTGTPPFTFTVEDNYSGSWADIVVDAGDLTGAGPYTYNFTVPDNPVWTAPDLPNVFNYNVTAITDGAGCGAGTVVGTGVDVDVYKKPETGPQYHIDNTWGN